MKKVHIEPNASVDDLKDRVRWISGPPAIRFADEGSNNHGAVIVTDGGFRLSTPRLLLHNRIS